MIAEIRDEYRQRILGGLYGLPEGWQEKFKLMYGRGSFRPNPPRSVEQTLALPMPEIVNEIPEEKLDWALCQIRNSEAKLKKQNAEAGV